MQLLIRGAGIPLFMDVDTTSLRIMGEAHEGWGSFVRRLRKQVENEAADAARRDLRPVGHGAQIQNVTVVFTFERFLRPLYKEQINYLYSGAWALSQRASEKINVFMWIHAGGTA
jgi:hypothetical protein